MKRILVVDQSQAVRETIALVLRRDFTIDGRPPLAGAAVLAADEAGIDLVIIGTPPGISGAVLDAVAETLPCPALFLVGSRALCRGENSSGKVGYLAKPFNPYELKESVERLLARAEWPEPPARASGAWEDAARYADFPYLPAGISFLAKRYALCRLPVLITGELGSGHEKVARAMHALADRPGPWLAASARELRGERFRHRAEMAVGAGGHETRRATLFLFGLESLEPPAQSSVVDFLEEAGERGWGLWTIGGSRVDLLERVFRGEFLDALYYRLATLTLRLPPLRERRNDLAGLAARLAEDYGGRLGLGKVELSAAAAARLSNYLWFGNLAELETVIARTLAGKRKRVIEAGDLALGEEAPSAGIAVPSPSSDVSPAGDEPAEGSDSPGEATETIVSEVPAGNGDYRDIRVLINELAHELKNPMVTIKTFTQLLDDRYDDAVFRDRFQQTVGSDIERMDDLLETLLDFSRFSGPLRERVLLYEELRRVVEDLLPECIEREATIRWGRKEESSTVVVDKEQFYYALGNVLRTVLVQVKPQGEIQIDVESDGSVVIGYVQEGGQMSSLTHFLELASSAGKDEEALPLRIHLAKFMLQRIGGGLAVKRLEGGKIVIKADLPVG